MNRILKTLTLAGLLSLGLTGCYADDDDVDNANAQIATLQQQLAALQSDNSATAAQIADLEAQIALLQGLTTNQEKAIAVLSALQSGDVSAVSQFVSADTYIQHNLGFGDGRESLLAAFDSGALAGTEVEIIRVLEDDDVVILHSQYRLFGELQVGVDIFRFDENGRIVEHWDNLQTADGYAISNANGNSMLDGALDVTNLAATQANKALVQDFVEQVLVTGDLSNFDQFFDADPGDGSHYIQHNPGVGNGTEALKGFLETLSVAGGSLYTETHQVYGMGNFVLTLSESNDADLDGQPDAQRTAYYDLFRVENNKIVEHWDVIQPIPNEADWANNNGKFYAQELYETKAVSVLNSLAVTSDDAPYTAQINVWNELVSEEAYIQHNQSFPDGRQAVLDSFSAGLLDGTSVDIRRTFNDGDIVVAHSAYQLFGQPQVGIDVFRFNNGEVVEHWDNLQIANGDAPSDVNGNSMLSGATVVRDKHLTEQNKATITAFVEDVLVGGNTSNFDSFFAPETDSSISYIQHNPDFPNGTSAIKGFVQQLEANGQSFYSSLEFVYGEGNFVLTMSQGDDADFDGVNDPQATAYFDLFRVENGLIVEHWDVIQTILNDDEAANSNGKW